MRRFYIWCELIIEKLVRLSFKFLRLHYLGRIELEDDEDPDVCEDGPDGGPNKNAPFFDALLAWTWHGNNADRRDDQQIVSRRTADRENS